MSPSKKTKNKQKIENNLIIASVILVAVFAVAILGSIFSNKTEDIKNTKTPITRYSAPSFQEDVIPEKSTLEELTNEYGEPNQTSDNVYEFESESLSRKNEATFENGTIKIFKEKITKEDLTISRINTEYGVPQHILYNELSEGGYFLYAYPEQGLSYIGKPATDTIIEIWYFIPTDFNSFLNTYAQGYTTDSNSINTY